MTPLLFAARFAFAALVAPAVAGASASPAPAQSTRMALAVDATDSPRKFLRATETLSGVQPGELTLVYPRWIPGEHAPSGPIVNFSGLKISAAGKPVRWTRDSVDMFAFHITIPEGATEVQIEDDFLNTAGATGFASGASSSANLLVLNWNELVLYPQNVKPADVQVTPSLKLPAGWKFGTALTFVSSSGPTQTFAPVSLEMLVDSPVLTGLYFREIPLADDVTPKHYLDIAADGPEDLNIKLAMVSAFSNLVRETGALYKSRHYTSYHFLVTLSDEVAHFGLEHHQSSDDRVPEKTFLDDQLALLSSDLLPHEFTHSWNGKYRRPAGLATQNYQDPMKGDLLWVYEGLTQYLGDVLAARSGIFSPEQYRAYLATSAADLDLRPGRTWRDLQDTATSAQILYATDPGWDNWRRNVDYYAEGELIWLDVDTTIRMKSKGKRSLNDFCALFLGLNGTTPPMVVPYTFDDVVSALNSVEPNDWAAFLRERLDSLAPHAPLDGITHGGYTLAYTPTQNEWQRAQEAEGRGANLWYSIGLRVGADGSVTDVLLGSPADAAGLGPGMNIIAINGRKFTTELMHGAVAATRDTDAPIEFIVENTGYFKTLEVKYRGGEKFPLLERDGKAPDLLDQILTPMVKR